MLEFGAWCGCLRAYRISRLGGVNTFCNSAIEPALENSIVDVELGLALERLLLPELGSVLGLGGAVDAAATAAPAATASRDAAVVAPTAKGSDHHEGRAASLWHSPSRISRARPQMGLKNQGSLALLTGARGYRPVGRPSVRQMPNSERVREQRRASSLTCNSNRQSDQGFKVDCRMRSPFRFGAVGDPPSNSVRIAQ